MRFLGWLMLENVDFLEINELKEYSGAFGGHANDSRHFVVEQNECKNGSASRDLLAINSKRAVELSPRFNLFLIDVGLNHLSQNFEQFIAFNHEDACLC